MNRADFRQLAQCRLEEAEVLFKSRKFSGAYYLAGYSIECALKARIARQTKQHDFPPEPNLVREIYSHDLEQLLKKAKLLEIFDREKARDAQLRAYWNTIKDWTVNSRYQLQSQKKARDIVKAVSDPRHGVLRCIKRFW
jgi:HEPN domain-containing protein